MKNQNKTPGKEEEQEIKNLLQKIMKENFLNLAKEIDNKFRKQRVLIKLNPKRPTLEHIIIKLPKVKDKERILKATREKQSYLQRSAHKTVS